MYQWLWALFLSFGLPGKAPAAPAAGKTLHPFFVSVTEINHNAKEKDLEITCKIFVEDMEATLEKNYKAKVDLSVQSPQADRFIRDYIGRHLLLAVEGKRVTLAYVGFEKQSESVYCYFHVPQTAFLKKLSVTNSLLHDFTDRQVNILHAASGGKRQSVKLDFPNKDAVFEF
jgi:hypothetical protein